MTLTSSLSAQMAQTGGSTGPAASATSAGSVSAGHVRTALSGQGMAQLQPPYGGTCGTDTTPQRDEHFLAHSRAHLIAGQLLTASYAFPGHLILRWAAYRLWIQSSIDVLPPF